MVDSYCLSGNVHAADVYLNGSKSITNRALIMAALSDGETLLKNASKSDDSELMRKAIAACNVKSEWQGNDLCVYGNGAVAPQLDLINVGAAGTVARFITALVALSAKGEVTIDGDKRMRERPIKPLVDALSSMGITIDYLGLQGSLPLRIKPTASCKKGCCSTCDTKRVVIDGTVSSQYITALLLTAPLLGGALKLEIVGDLVSKSYIDMTCVGMADFGVSVENDNYKVFYVKGDQHYHSRTYLVEGDASGASYFLGLAAVSGKEITVYNIAENSAQGDAKFARVLERMGCNVKSGWKDSTPWISLSRDADLQAIDVDMSSMPDTVQTLAVVAALANGKSRISGVSTLKNKETDRLFAVTQELAKIGIKAYYSDDVLEIEGGSEIKPATIKTYSDHRMAMAFSMLAGKYDGICIEDPAVVSKSMPDFWEKLAALGIDNG